MVKKIQMLILITVLMLFAAPAGAGPDVQEGMWEITTEAKMSGLQMPPQKHTQCFMNDDLVPMDPTAPQSCTIKEKSYKGNTLNWTMECSSEGVKTVAKGSITYDKDSFSGGVDITIGGSNMKFTNTMSGRRLGPCK
jgi:hypothetical protein